MLLQCLEQEGVIGNMGGNGKNSSPRSLSLFAPGWRGAQRTIVVPIWANVCFKKGQCPKLEHPQTPARLVFFGKFQPLLAPLPRQTGLARRLPQREVKVAAGRHHNRRPCCIAFADPTPIGPVMS